MPSQAQIDALLDCVGWHRIEWRRPVLKLQAGMQIDLGGIGKEYAVDAAAGLAEKIAPGLSCLINFGGDVAVRNARHDGQAWRVGIENSARTGAADASCSCHAARSLRAATRGASCSATVIAIRTFWTRAPVGPCAMRRTRSRSQQTPARRPARSQRWQCFRARNAEGMLRASGLQYWLQ